VKPRIAIRADASVQIGTGHILRCLLLAEMLQNSGLDVEFLCRVYPGDLINWIRSKGFKVHELQAPLAPTDSEHHYSHDPLNSTASGIIQSQDAQGTIHALQERTLEWLIVDCYGLDRTWEEQLRSITKNIFAIDDLANRKHDCDLLLDQNFFSEAHSRYEGLVSRSTKQLLGPKYALLRKEFVTSRQSLKPKSDKIKRIFVFFGGTDPDNVTGRVLDALTAPRLQHLQIDVVIGLNNPNRKSIEEKVGERKLTTLHVQIDNIAELMAAADLALGAGGSGILERLCLGLHCLIITTADNQRSTIDDLHDEGLVTKLGSARSIRVETIQQAITKSIEYPEVVQHNAIRGMKLVTGGGAALVLRHLLQRTYC